MALNLFIIGPSGCGKSTQAKMVAEKYNLTHISMGQVFRDEMAIGSGYGLEAKSYIEKGVWVPDDLTFDMLVNKIKPLNYQNFIIDGFPRVLNQGKIIEYFLKKQSVPFSLLIHLTVSEAEIAARRALLNKDFQDASRIDTTPQAAKQRQISYDETIGSIREYFKDKGLFHDIDGNRPVEPIFTDICLTIDSLK